MLRIIKSTALASVVMLVFSSILSSFTSPAGGDMFEVYINKKLAVRQFVHLKEPVKTLQIDQSNYSDEIEVYYSHCGQTGTSRVVSLRDANNKLLKEWRFQDAPGSKTPMSCSLKEVNGIQKLAGNELQLYYASRELPEGRKLAIISGGSSARATR